MVFNFMPRLPYPSLKKNRYHFTVGWIGPGADLEHLVKEISLYGDFGFYDDKAGRLRWAGTARHIKYEACPESKDTSRVGRYGYFYAYYGNTAVDLDLLPVSRARLTVVEPALFE